MTGMCEVIRHDILVDRYVAAVTAVSALSLEAATGWRRERELIKMICGAIVRDFECLCSY